MGFWLFFWRSKTVDGVQKQKSGEVRKKMAQVGKGNTGKKFGGQSEKLSRANSKRPRMDKSTTMSQSSSSGLRGSTATPSSAQATMTSSRHTPADSIGQVEKKELDIGVGERRMYQHNPKSTSSVGQDHFTVSAIPTLHARRGDDDVTLPRRKSSKRKAEDQAREREIRAMSSPVPIPRRPLSYAETPLRQDTKKAPAKLRKHTDQYPSEISLPVPESLSDIGITSNQRSFKVNALDMLSPRPTVRSNRNPRFTASSSQNFSKTSARHTIVEEDYFSKRRIDNLADSLDASALRELMERDERRRERKRKTDQARLEQKLHRTSEKEKQREAQRPNEASIGGDAGPPGHILSSPPAPPLVQDDARDLSADPFSDYNTIDPDLPRPPMLRPGSSIYTRNSQASFSPPTSPTQRTFDHASLSQTSNVPRETTPDIVDTADLSRRLSERGNAPLSTWTSFFRRGGTRGKSSPVDRGKHASGEFSNTSRDSVSRTQPQISMVGAPRTFRKSGTPQRTQSKFREDLPELPLSPPDSRVQSPEIGTEPSTVSALQGQVESAAESSRPHASSSTRAIFDQNPSADEVSPSQNPEAQNPAPAAALSRSLASVDSEASWLSGRPAKRSSVLRDRPLRQSQSSLQPHPLEPDMGEEVDVADDPYFNRLSPDAEQRRRSSPSSALRKASSTALNLDPESDFEDEPQVQPLPDTSNERWHSGLGRQPTLVRQAAQARSKEGLLKEYQATDAESGVVDDETSDLESPDVEYTDLQASSSPIFRAQSVHYGAGHVRHISAGSAKLLDIRRSSFDSKRQSLPRTEQSSTPIRSSFLRKEE